MAGDTWLAGEASAPFPVADGAPLAGYAAREGPAEGTLDSLTIGTLLLERDGARLAIVAADVAAVDAELVQEIAALAGLGRSELVLCASHTHSGPAGVVARLHPAGANALDPALRARFVETVTGSIAAARRDRQPVALLAGTVEAPGVAANRNDPALPADQRLSVLAARRGDGSLHALLVHFACHPTILGAASRLVSADFPGALRRELASMLREEDTSPAILFVNGAAGDVSSRFTRRGQDAAEVARMGALLARAAREALRAAVPLDGTLRHASTAMPVAPRADLARGGASMWAETAAVSATPAASVGELRVAQTRAQGATMLAALSALPPGAIVAECDLDAWAIGDCSLIAVPAELFSSFGQQIVEAAAGKTLVLGYANGYVGYLADRAAHESATYEALASPYGPEAGERLVEVAIRLLADLRMTRRAVETTA